MIQSKLSSWNLTNKWVIVRVDWNSTLLPNNTDYFDDYKLIASLPTLQKIQSKGGKIVLLTHWSNPQNKDHAFSTKHFLPWLKKQGFNSCFATTPKDVLRLQKNATYTCIILENIRFFKEEKIPSKLFAQKLGQLGDFFVQDAFGTLHRQETSMTLLPELFDDCHRTIGFLIEHELNNLNNFINNIKKPFLMIMGGSKISTKLPVIKHFLKTADTIILLPAIAFTFLKAKGFSTGKSLLDELYIPLAKNLLNEAQKNRTNIILPLDWRVSHSSFETSKETYIIQHFSEKENEVGISIGPKTVKEIGSLINKAQTIFFNGPCANLNYPTTTVELAEILHMLTYHKKNLLVAGGDALTAFKKLGFGTFMQENLNYFSTGGGATLAYLAEEHLPGLTYFL